MPARDYYDVLGISRSATADEVKKAYRKLARSHHPDLNPGDKAAEAKFKEAQSAYDILGDPEKRKQYDTYGHAAFEGGSAGPRAGAAEWAARQGPSGGPEVDFSQFFGGGAESAEHGMFDDILGRFGVRGGRRAGPTRGRDLEASLAIPFTTAVLGGSTSITLSRADGTPESLSIKIPPGSDDGTKLRLKGRGEPGDAGAKPGDLTIVIEVERHPYFERDGDNVRVEVPISIDEAALGAKVEVPTLAGTRVAVPVPAGSDSGRKLRVRGKGVPARGNHPAGDLLVSLKVVAPKNLDEAGKLMLREFAEKYPSQPRDGLW